MTIHRFLLCDVFTSVPLAGSQLAVFPDGEAVPEELLQPLARELNFTETVFLYPSAGSADRRVRFFTPAHELPFAGYPLIGAAMVVADGRRSAVTLETGAGDVHVTLEHRRGGAVFAWMAQRVPTFRRCERERELLDALGVEASVLPVDVADNGIEHTFVALDSEAAVAAVQPDLAALSRLGVRANVFAAAGRDVRTRMFAPVDGIAEDIATGSAAGPLACHLVRQGWIAAGTEIRIAQGAELNRPSVLHARTDGEGAAIAAVAVGGSAVPVGSGSFELPG